MARPERIILFILLYLLGHQAHAQVVATLTAVDKAIQVGKPFMVELSVRHPESMVVVFPDSAKDFTPFELYKTDPRPTQTTDGTSIDAALYSLMTWEIDSLQRLQLPVRFLRGPGDTAEVLSTPVDLTFLPVIPVYSDTLKLKMHGGLVDIQEPFPWLGLLVLTAGLSLVGITVYLTLRKPMGKALRRMKVKKEWERFRRGHESVLKGIANQEAFTEALQSNWKQYFDRKGLFKLPAMTTPDLAEALEGSGSLSEEDIALLMELGGYRDRIVFGGISGDESRLRELHTDVEKIMSKEYHRRKEAAEL